MYNSNISDSIDRDLDNFRPDSHWDDDAIIAFYKKKTREICAKLEEEEKNKKKNLLLLNNNRNLIIKKGNPQNMKYKGASFRSQNSSNNSKIRKTSLKRIQSANPQKIRKVEETESVLNMLFPYVNENDFKIEPFKSGADLRKEHRKKMENNIIKLNQERRIKSNFLEKFQKYDKELNTFRDNPSIRCSSAYATEEQIRRREFIKSKKLWLSSADFKRVFGKRSENERIKIQQQLNENHERDKYHEPSNIIFFRSVDKSKWVCKDNFNPYEFHIIRQIGEGSFGKIYCVQWIRNGEKYAMKKLNLFGQEELIILQHKVKIVQNLQKKTRHNGFTTIYGDKCIPAPRPNEYHYYIIMELVEKDWEVELKRRRINAEFYTEYELLDIVKQLVKTLSIMQQNNVTHRDIKPQNVLIKEGFYKLCDFDEVKIIYNPQPCMHSVRGSELYMSPILFYAYQNKTPSIVHNTYKSDVFSLGMCILLAAGLTAKTLCDIREIKDMNIISEIIISRLVNRYSPNFIKLIIKMLQLEETLRFDFIELEEYILQIWPN